MKEFVVNTIQKNKYFAQIIEDSDCADDPMNWDNLGTMVCFHPRYNLGHKHNFDDPQEFRDWCKDHKDEIAIIMPLYLYDHSGISISVSHGYPYNDRWDSGQAGWIYITKEKIKQEYSCKIVSTKRKQLVEKYLEGEVETYDQYLRGEVYGFKLFRIDDNEFDPDVDDPEDYGEEIDSCWGYYGLEDLKKEIVGIIDWNIKDDESKQWEKLAITEFQMQEA